MPCILQHFTVHLRYCACIITLISTLGSRFFSPKHVTLVYRCSEGIQRRIKISSDIGNAHLRWVSRFKGRVLSRSNLQRGRPVSLKRSTSLICHLHDLFLNFLEVHWVNMAPQSCRVSGLSNFPKPYQKTPQKR